MIFIKTLIEFFDECQTENVVSPLRLMPEKVIYIGYKNKMNRRKASALENFLAKKCPHMQVEFIEVEKFDFDEVCAVLAKIADEAQDCCFDITGGEEPILAAMGAVSVGRNVSIIQTNVRRGNVFRLKGDDKLSENEFPQIFIDEIIELFGGSVIHGESGDTEWNFNSAFFRDIDLLWSVCKKDPAKWNKETVIFKTIAKYGTIDHSLTVKIPLADFERMYPNFDIERSILTGLSKAGLICELSMHNGVLSFRYKNSNVYSCMLKAGNILELYAYRAAYDISQSESGFYSDMDIGIYLDWDGVIHEKYSSAHDTKNEIDLLLIRGLRPIFISCKNGEVKKEDLYELETVANRLGGKYAGKVILTNYLCSDRSAAEYIVQRARDMHINLIYDIDKMSYEEFKRTLRRATV